MLKLFDFDCAVCGNTFEALVEGVDGQPEECPACTADSGFTKHLASFSLPTTIVVDYPGSKRFKAGAIHTHGDRPAEKAGRQISVPARLK